MDDGATARGLSQQLAPGVVAMTGWSVLAFLAGFTQLVVGPALDGLGLGLPAPVQLAIQVGVFLAAAVLAHRSYLRARTAIVTDPSLSGGWYVENAWWLLVAITAFVVTVLVAGYVVVVR